MVGKVDVDILDVGADDDDAEAEEEDGPCGGGIDDVLELDADEPAFSFASVLLSC